MNRKKLIFLISVLSLVVIFTWSRFSTSGNPIPVKVPKIPSLAPIDLNFPANSNRTLDWLDLWRKDEKCEKYEVNLLPDEQRSPVAFVSFPGSGNTWIRAVLMGLTGVYCDSVYADDEVFTSKDGSTYKVPLYCGCTLMTKTHDFTLDGRLTNAFSGKRSGELEDFQGRGILLIRDPYKAIVSYRNFAYSGMQGLAPELAFAGLDWDSYVARSVISWELLASVWIRGLKQGGIVYYERIRKDPENELRRLANILGVQNIDPQRFQCVLEHLDDNSFKRTTHSSSVTYYTPSQKLLISYAIERVDAILREYALDPLPVEHYSFYNESNYQ